MTPASRTFTWFRQFAKLWGFALFCIFVVYVFRDVVLPFLFAILVAYLLAPLVERASRYKIGSRPFPRAAAVIILYVFILAILSLFISSFVRKLSGDFSRLFREAPQVFAKVNKDYLPRAGAWIDDNFGAEATGEPGDETLDHSEAQGPRAIYLQEMPDGRFRLDLEAFSFEVTPAEAGKFIVAPPARLEGDAAPGGKWERAIKQWLSQRLKSTEGESRRALEYGQKFIAAIVGGIARLFLVLMVAAFILVDLDRIQGFLRSLVPDRYRGDYDRIVTGVDRGLSGVIRGQLLICVINGLLTYAGLLIFKVKYAALLGAIAAIMSLIPIFGSILSSVPIVVVALISSATFDIRKGLFVLGWIILIHLIEANVLNPKIMGNAAKIHPVLVVFALIAGEHAYGLVGALFAVPVASIIQTIFVYYWRRPRIATTVTPLSPSDPMPPPAAGI
jgi:predicted PurR-regulated permease PerM